MDGVIYQKPEFGKREFKKIPPNIDVYGMFTDASFKEITYKRGPHAGRGGQVWDLQFQIIGGEYANQRIWGSILSSIEWSEELGEYNIDWVGDAYKASSLLLALGYDLATSGDGQKYMPKTFLTPNQAAFEDLKNGSGQYNIPLLGTIIGVTTANQNKRVQEKSADGTWADVIGPDGQPTTKQITVFGDFFRPTNDMLIELAGEATASNSTDSVPF